MELNTTYRLSDSVIAQIAKIVQVAILTGTDITDNLRMIRLTSEDGLLGLDEEYRTMFDTHINSMLEEITPEKEDLTEE